MLLFTFFKSGNRFTRQSFIRSTGCLCALSLFFVLGSVAHFFTLSICFVCNDRCKKFLFMHVFLNVFYWHMYAVANNVTSSVCMCDFDHQ